MFNEVFAAANTYEGFTSRFSEVIDYSTLTRLFILKGGPGTGKSSFMRRMDKELSTKAKIKKILCSSDKDSLDGITIELRGKRVAIIDGTAPHSVDPTLPGARDSIIDLGENWNEKILYENRDKIESLNKEKKICYDTAYAHLRAAGAVDLEIRGIISGSIDFKKIRNLSHELSKKHSEGSEEGCESVILSSFSSEGYTSLVNSSSDAYKIVRLPYSFYTGDLILKETKKRLYARGLHATPILSPLSPIRYEGLYLDKEKTLYLIAKGEVDIHGDDFILKKGYTEERVRVFTESLKFIEDEAARWFKIAKDFHFRLEDIYSFSMDFTKNDVVFSKTLEKIKNILEI